MPLFLWTSFSEESSFDFNRLFEVGFSASKILSGRRFGLMVSEFASGSGGPGSNPGRGHCVGFLGKAFYSHTASLQQGV